MDESAILLYADALLNAGQGKRAAPLIRSAVAISLTANQEPAGPFANFEASTPWLLRAIDRTGAALDSGNARRIAGELDAYFARPPRALYAERRLARIALSRLERADARESLYWQGRYDEWTVEFPSITRRAPPDYVRAIACGDRRAMRRLGAMYLDGNAEDDQGRSAYYGLVLIDDPTADERALRDALEPKFGKTPLDMTNPLMRAAQARTHEISCDVILQFIASRQR